MKVFRNLASGVVIFLAGIAVGLIIGIPVALALKGSDLYDWLQLVFIAITVALTLRIAIDTNQSAHAARDAANEARRAVQAQILSSLLDEYKSVEMRRAIRTLSDWYDGQHGQLADTLRMFNQKEADIPVELDEARRCVSHHIQKITIMWLRSDLLDNNIAMAALDRGKVQIYRELVEPLEWAITSSYNRTSFETLGKEYRVPRRAIPGLEGWENQID
jgi:hypothetical protein